MSVDLMGMLKDAVSKQVMNKIGGMVGLDGTSTNKAFEGAAGSILGGMMKKSSTQQGIDLIFGAAQQNDGGLFDNLGDLLGKQDATDKLQKQGGGIMDMVFGGDRAKAESSVGKSLGLSSGIVGKLMSLAGPMLMGVIGRYVKNKALNAVGLGSLLGSQGSYLNNYVPAALTSSLGLSSFMGDAGDAVKGAAGSVGNAVGGAANSVGNAVGGAANSVGSAASGVGNAAANTAGQAADAGGGLIKMLLPLVLLGAIGWGLWQFVLSPMMNGANPVAAVGDGISGAAGAVGDGVSGAVGAVGDGVTGAVGGMGMEMPKMEMPGMDLGGFDMNVLGDNGPKLTQGMTDISTGFQGLAAGGEEAATGLAGTITGFGDTLGDMNIGEMGGPAKTAVTGMLGQFSGVLEGLLSKVPESLQGIIRPAVEGLVQKISGFGG